MKTTIVSLRERASRMYINKANSEALTTLAEDLQQHVEAFRLMPTEEGLRDMTMLHARSIRLLGLTELSTFGGYGE